MVLKLAKAGSFTKFIIIAEFILVSYLLYALTKAVYTSYQIDQHIKAFAQETARIEDDNRQKSEDFDYYNSNAYIEKIAKQNLGLVNPGEEVIVIPSSNSGTTSIIGGQGFQENSESDGLNISNPEKWWKFFFDIKQ